MATQLEFTSWPPGSNTLPEPMPLLLLVNEVTALHKKQRNLSTPIIVHCGWVNSSLYIHFSAFEYYGCTYACIPMVGTLHLPSIPFPRQDIHICVYYKSLYSLLDICISMLSMIIRNCSVNRKLTLLLHSLQTTMRYVMFIWLITCICGTVFELPSLNFPKFPSYVVNWTSYWETTDNQNKLQQ